MLYQTPKGNWVNPKLITSVRAYDESSLSGLENEARIPPRIVICADDFVEICECESFEDAKGLRDLIAKEVNKL